MVDSLSMVLPSPLNRLEGKILRRRFVNAGERVFCQDEPARGLYYLADGEVKMMRATQAGEEILMHRAVAGSTFAEASLFDTHYHCHGIVSKDAHIVECSRAAVRRAYQEDADFAFAMSVLFANQMQQARKRLELLSIRDAQERVFSALLEGLLVNDIQSFASDIALSPESVYRSLSKLAKAGRIRKTGYGRYEL